MPSTEGTVLKLTQSKTTLNNFQYCDYLVGGTEMYVDKSAFQGATWEGGELKYAYDVVNKVCLSGKDQVGGVPSRHGERERGC